MDDCYFDALFSDRETVPGNFVNADGVILGQHKGLQYYTIGQRRGLGISSAKPLYVKKIDAKKNEIVLAEKNDILASVLYAEDFVWAGNDRQTTSVNIGNSNNFNQNPQNVQLYACPYCQKAVTFGQNPCPHCGNHLNW